MKKKKSTALTVLILLAAFIITDLMLGHFLNARELNSFRTQHFYLHHTLLPDRKGLATWGGKIYHVKTNSLGCRDRSCRKIELSRAGRRLLIIGDSHAEGVGVEYEKTVSGILQDSLSGFNFDVINASSVSYSPKLYYLKTKFLTGAEGLRVTDLLVMIDISDIQNEIAYEKFEPDTSDRAKKKYEIRRFFLDNSLIYRRVSTLIKKNRVRKFIRGSEYFREYVRNNPDKNLLPLYISFFNRFDNNQLLSDPGFHSVQHWFYDKRYKPLAEKGLETGMENIKKLKDLCDRHNINMILSVHPWREQVSRGDTCDYYVTRWKDFCRVNHIGFINLYPVFIHPPSSVVFSDELFLPDDNHWSIYGNKLVAGEVVKKYLPAGGSK